MLAVERIAVGVQDLLERITDARKKSDELFALVKGEAIYLRPIAERHRIIFYVGHLEAFDWNLLHDFGGIVPAGVSREGGRQEFDRLFAFGIDPVGGGLPTDVPADWPAREEVTAYVGGIRRALDERLAAVAHDQQCPVPNGIPLQTLLNVAIEHRLMHVETLAYMFHQLPFDQKIPDEGRRPPLALAPDTSTPLEDEVGVPEGTVTLGLPRNSAGFGWDNEYEAHTVQVPPFRMDRYKVTNRRYLEFMADGGYQTRTLWRDGDWDWKQAQQLSHPVFWRRDADHWLYRTMFKEVTLPLDWPVYVSQAEAGAFARWAGKSLPTEAEWQHAAYGSPDGETRFYPWGSQAPDAESPAEFGNFDLRRWDPTPVNAFPAGHSAFGIHDLLGNGWEWTSTVFAPFPGFAPFPFYRGYSADFFDGKHFVMKGGSTRTAACMLRPTFRNWFQAHYPYAYSGFRCVRH